MNEHDIHPTMAALREAVTAWQTPIVDEMAQQAATPYTILITTILSLRTQDGTTAAAARRLFELAQTPETMLEVPAATIAQAIYPVGFYNTKAETILTVSRLLIERYGGAVPDTVEELLTLPGVGRKTANLVVTMGYNKPGICVDTHVHRITNRWGYVQTKTPEQTEFALRARLPAEYWISINGYLVSLGQNICHPTSPRCSQCPITAWCDRIGVTRSR
jgi:endonuclease-3